jgi:hypothetical protein
VRWDRAMALYCRWAADQPYRRRRLYHKIISLTPRAADSISPNLGSTEALRRHVGSVSISAARFATSPCYGIVGGERRGRRTEE